MTISEQTFVAGTKFVIKQDKGTRKQFLILNGEAVLAFVENGKKFVDCDSYTEVTTEVNCKTVDGLNTVDLEKAPGTLWSIVMENCLFYPIV